MNNIKVTIERGYVSDGIKGEILDTFLKRIEKLPLGSFNAQIILNPILSGREVESLSGNSKRYIIDEDGLVDDETRIRLATLKNNNTDLSILFVFEKVVTPFYNPLQVNNTGFFPAYLSHEIGIISNIVEEQKNKNDKNYNTFCVSGDVGCGKTFFIRKIAEKTKSTLWKLSYGDIDAENTGLISKKVNAFFKKVKSGDFVLIENAESFLCGRDLNRFVKNALVSELNRNRGFFIFIETSDPSLFENDIKKLIFRYVYVKPLVEKERKNFLKLFLDINGIKISEEDLDSIQTTGMSVKDLKDASYIASILNLNTEGSTIHSIVSDSIDEINASKLHSSIASDSPFMAIRPKYKLEDLILPPEKSEVIRYAAALVSNVSVVYDKWNFSAIDPCPRSIINFYGKPGTGKTMCAHAIADFLGKDLLALNYAEIESKYIGDAPKKLESAFAYARQHDTVMFFDEADSFLGKRIEDVSHSADQALNSLRSTMLIQLEIFEGVVIFASNLRENYDKAFKSRFLYEIEFDLPDLDCRKQIIKNYSKKIVPIQNASYTDEQIASLACKSEGLSGREIKSTILEALNKFAYEKKDTMSSTESSLPFDLMSECFKKKKRQNEDNVIVKNNVDEDKKKIAASLAEKYGISQELTSENSDKLSALISLAYCTAWSDNVLDEREMLVIKNAEKELGITTEKDFTKKENLPQIETLVSHIQSLGITKQAIELCCRIVSADGSYLESEKNFIHKLCNSLNMPESQVCSVDEIVELMAKESNLLDNISA